LRDNRARSDDTVVPFDRRQSPVAAELQRGVCRRFRALGLSVVTELSLANGRRADVVALSGGGDVLIVEIKSCLLDYQSDGKWQDYLPFCDQLYFAVAADFPCDVIPAAPPRPILRVRSLKFCRRWGTRAASCKSCRLPALSPHC